MMCVNECKYSPSMPLRSENAARRAQAALSYLLFGLIALGFMVAGAAIARLLT